VALLAPGVARADTPGLYRAHCSVCHGDAGRGDGPAAAMLTPRPRDFSTGRYKYRSTPPGTRALVADLVRSIRDGVRGTSMPGFGDLLAPAAIDGLARHVLALAPSAPGAPALVVPPGAPDGAAARGAALYAASGCATCHGRDGRGVDWRPPREGPAAARPPTRLDEPWTFGGGADEQAIALRILTGLEGTEMPAYGDALSVEDALAVARFVRSLAREPAWASRDPATVRTAGVATEPLARGRYLVRAMQCPLCHTPISATTGAYDAARFLAGGMRVSAWPWGVWFSRNLTPDAETGLGRWTEAEIVAALTRGVSRDGRRLDPMAMPWPWFSRLTPADAAAIATYLKALPPVRREVPSAVLPSLAERAGGKLLALLGLPVAVKFWGGDATNDPALRRAEAASPVRRAAALTLGWGTLALAGATPVLAWARACRCATRIVTAAAASCMLAGWLALAAWPPFGLLGAEATTRWLLLGTPAISADLTESERALAERGEYVATIAPCGLCHTPASPFVGFLTGRTLAGGMEARWNVYGRAVAGNLTPHGDGLGGVSDDTVLRAMTSGVRRDGTIMHWQAMSWDIVSNWSEEDRRAVVAYLRALPAEAGRVPPPRPPTAADPAADSFFFGDAARR